MEMLNYIESSLVVQIIVGILFIYVFHSILKHILRPGLQILLGIGLFVGSLAAINAKPESTIISLAALALIIASVELIWQGSKS